MQRVAEARTNASHQIQEVEAIHDVIGRGFIAPGQVILHRATHASRAAEHSENCSMIGRETVEASPEMLHSSLSGEVLESAELVEKLDETARKVSLVLDRPS